MSGAIDVTHCRLCGGDRTSTMFEAAPYRVLRCRDCSLVWVTPRWDDTRLSEVYGAEYWRSDSPKTKGYADYTSDAPLYLKTFRRRMKFVRRWIPRNARVLDVGCAAGYFLRVAREHGHDVHGVELSAAIAREAREHLGDDRVFVGTLDALPDDRPGCQKRSFDAVTMWDVVEHVPDPHALLRAARAMLKPDGVLIVETQNVDSRFARLLGPRWHHFKHEEHIYHFNPVTIARLLEQSGFAVAKLTSSFGGKYVSFGFIAERAQRLGRLASIVFRPLGLLRSANVYLNFGDEMVVVARPVATAAPSTASPRTAVHTA